MLQQRLENILNPERDATNEPPTAAEIEFLNLMFAHFQNSWIVAKVGGITTLQEIRDDIRGTFPLPLPSAVWDATKQFRNRKFVKFAERALRK